MKFEESAAKLADYRRQIADIRGRMRALQAEIEPEVVKDYGFATLDGSRKLSSLFGDKDDLIIVHNMGVTCRNCTLWADGYNGLYPHLADRAAFIVASPDPPHVQKAFAAGRQWIFPMVSYVDKAFVTDMGYLTEAGYRPGVSVFRREEARILRVSSAGFKPFDDFCALWHVLDLLPGGVGDWRPRFSYS